MSGKTNSKKVSEQPTIFTHVETKYGVASSKKRQWKNDGTEFKAKRRQTNFSRCEKCAEWGYANNRLPANALSTHFKHHETIASETATDEEKYNAQRLLVTQRNNHNFEFDPKTRTTVEPKYYLAKSVDDEKEPMKNHDEDNNNEKETKDVEESDGDEEEEPEERQEDDDDQSYVASGSGSDDLESSGTKFRARTARILIKHMDHSANAQPSSSQPQNSSPTDFLSRTRPRIGYSFSQPVQSVSSKKSLEESIAAKELANMSVSSTPELLSPPSSQPVYNNQLLDINSTQDIIEEAHNLITRKGEIERAHKEKIAKLDITKEKFSKMLLQLELEREVEIANKQKLLTDIEDKYKAVAVLLLKELQK